MLTFPTLATVTVNGRERAAGGDPGGTPRAVIRLFLWRFAGGKCVVCGQQTRLDAPRGAEDAAEAGHMLPGHDGSKTGWQQGNLANVCRICNEGMSDRDNRPFAHLFEFPQGIPMAWPAGWRNGKPARVTGTHADNARAAIARIYG